MNQDRALASKSKNLAIARANLTKTGRLETAYITGGMETCPTAAIEMVLNLLLLFTF